MIPHLQYDYSYLLPGTALPGTRYPRYVIYTWYNSGATTNHYFVLVRTTSTLLYSESDSVKEIEITDIETQLWVLRLLERPRTSTTYLYATQATTLRSAFGLSSTAVPGAGTLTAQGSGG